MQVVKQELQRQESSRLPVGDTERLSVALTDQKVMWAPIETLKEVLRWVMVKIGLRANNFPADQEKELLIEHIYKNFPGFTCSEIKLAFEMAIAGKLIVEVNCYENFSCLYFSNIMNAYKKWAIEEHTYLEKSEKPKEEKLLNDIPMTNDEVLEINHGVWKALKDYRAISTKCWDILLTEGKIKGLEGEEREFVIKKATTDLHEELRTSGESLSYDQKEKRILQMCKKLTVQKFFNENKIP